MAENQTEIPPEPPEQPEAPADPAGGIATEIADPPAEEEEKAGAESPDSVDKPQGADTARGVENPIDLDFLLDIPLTVRVEIGRTRMLVNDLLQLGQGSVIELQKLVGEPFEVLVNEKLVARGEVVVVNERFGVRLTDIISPMERIEQLA